MNFINIKESGTNNILLWAISNGADIKSDLALQSIISDELSYIITIDNVNFFELFRLTQIYRDKIRIIDESKAEMPNSNELEKLFNGTYKPDDKSDDIKLYNIVEHCGNMFINLTSQMINDNHIINSNTIRMFLPMISRKFTIEIPVGFCDIVKFMSSDEANEIYNENYPNTLNNIINNPTHGVLVNLNLAFIRNTSIIKYDKKYDKYINILKYSPLKSCNNNKLYKIAVLGFFKYDNISKTEIYIDLFNINKNSLNVALKRMAYIDNPLEIEFVIQLPIQYMQMFENFFSGDEVTIAYESSMSNIIDHGIINENFVTSEYNNEGDSSKIYEQNNAIESYKIRINEANQTMLNAIPILLNSNGDVDVTSVFSMFPSIYTTRAVMRVNIDTLVNKLSTHHDPIIKDMINDAIDIANSINDDINNSI